METNNHTGRVRHEIAHGKKLASADAESIWNWSSPAGRKRADRRARLIVSTGNITSRDSVLEIGCGTGLFTRKVHELSGARITATDISEELLTIARKGSSIENGLFMIGDAMKLPFPDGEFDAVFGSSILHHLDFEKALSEALRVLKRGGRVIFAEPNMLNPQIFIQKNVPFIKRLLGDSPDETAIVRWKLAREMKRLGFSRIRIIPHDFLHPKTPTRLIGSVEAISRVLEKVPIAREIAGSVIIYAEKPAV